MKRIKLADFSFLGTQPSRCRRTHRSLLISLAPQTALPPAGPMMVAVSGAPAFVCTLKMQRAKEAEAGVLLYHTQSSYITVGVHTNEIRVTTVIQGWKQELSYPIDETDEHLSWEIVRAANSFTISVQTGDGEHLVPVGTFTLPGTERSVSFGWYAANTSTLEATVAITAFTYQHTL